MVNARRFNFSPDAAPYCPSPALHSLDGLSGSDSAASTPKLVGGSPCLSTPGCNPCAKPFVPASVLQGMMLPSRLEEKAGLNMQKMLDLRTSPSEVHFPIDVPSEVLSSSSSSWLTDACKSLTLHSSSSESSSDTGADHAPLPPARTSLSFMKAMNRNRKLRKDAATALSPSVCA
eukprot:TRINITY_DN3140_c1_g1_i1.p2 TRINITY_DN3140_c1_g1~~TRINITY_DN3140_c1_g1_i1.p2  ORF type:complete len:175 (+),score=31.97 TRINITY_DN3140_c1_g1_i1:96-620(+)